MDDPDGRAERPAAAQGEAVAGLGGQRPGVEIDPRDGNAGERAEGDLAGDFGLARRQAPESVDGETGAATAVAGIAAQVPAFALAREARSGRSASPSS